MKTKKNIVLTLLTAILILGGYTFFQTRNMQHTYSFETTKIEKDTIKSIVTATGCIEPVTSVEVGTQVSGIISKIYVDYNSQVSKGQVIAELDKTNLMSELSSAQANLSSTQSDYAYQEANFKRYQNLFEKGLVSRNDFEVARLGFLKAAQDLKINQENVKKAQTNLSYAIITSPIDGIVLGKDVEEGQTVASSYSTPTLFTIAQDLTDMQVVADIDEADIGHIKEGQKVSFTVDAFPDDIFHGTVTQVRQEATTESNVVTYEVVIAAPNNDLKLKPGLTANVNITTLERPNIVSVKSKALRFTPDLTKLKNLKIEDCNSTDKLWIKNSKGLKAYPVKTGITDGTRTEIKDGLPENTEVVTSMNEILQDADNKENEVLSNPFMPRPGENKNKKK